MIPSAECTKNAADCRSLARTAATKEQRDILFDLARTWETMAKHAARLEQNVESVESR